MGQPWLVMLMACRWFHRDVVPQTAEGLRSVAAKPFLRADALISVVMMMVVMVMVIVAVRQHDDRRVEIGSVMVVMMMMVVVVVVIGQLQVVLLSGRL